MLKHRRLTSKDERWLPPPSTLDEEESRDNDDLPRRIGVADHFEEDNIAKALLHALLLEDEDASYREVQSILESSQKDELGLFAFDEEELADATFYLGTSFRHINLMQVHFVQGRHNFTCILKRVLGNRPTVLSKMKNLPS